MVQPNFFSYPLESTLLWLDDLIPDVFFENFMENMSDRGQPSWEKGLKMAKIDIFGMFEGQ